MSANPPLDFRPLPAIDYSEPIRVAIDTLNALFPNGWSVEDLRASAPDVPTPTLDATLASWTSSGRLQVVGEEPAHHRAAKGRKVKLYSASEGT